jgi:hypothetical protein
MCPQCRSTRVLPFAPGSRWPWIRAIVGWTSILTLILWPLLGLKGLLSVLPVATAVELWFRMRLRVVMECEHCGFDPFLYVKDRAQAIARVKAKLEQVYTERKKAQEAAQAEVADAVANDQKPASDSASKNAKPGSAQAGSGGKAVPTAPTTNATQ